jgi:hypothetical protein
MGEESRKLYWNSTFAYAWITSRSGEFFGLVLNKASMTTLDDNMKTK